MKGSRTRPTHSCKVTPQTTRMGLRSLSGGNGKFLYVPDAFLCVPNWPLTESTPARLSPHHARPGAAAREHNHLSRALRKARVPIRSVPTVWHNRESPVLPYAFLCVPYDSAVKRARAVLILCVPIRSVQPFHKVVTQACVPTRSNYVPMRSCLFFNDSFKIRYVPMRSVQPFRELVTQACVPTRSNQVPTRSSVSFQQFL